MTQVILLERVENLGNIGDVVTVKPGFARNYLLPQEKALRASNENIAYFEAQKKHIESANADKKKEAEKQVKSFKDLTVPLIRQASESGQLFGSVTSRDIAEVVAEKSGIAVTRAQVDINRNFKMIGLFPVTIVLHPEVRTDVIINIARSNEEAEIQQETGVALIAEAEAEPEPEEVNDKEESAAADESDSPEVNEDADEATDEPKEEEA